MSLEKIYNVIVNTAEKAYMQKDTQDILNMSAALLHMANAYQMMKDVEMHERFHMQNTDGRGFILPGEAPLEGGGTN